MITSLQYTLRRLRLAILGWGLGLAAIGVITVLVFDLISDRLEMVQEFMKGMPPVIVALAGDVDKFTTAGGWLHAKFFMPMPVMLGFFGVVAGAGLLIADEERGRLDLLMACPVSRARMFFGRVLGLIAATALILLACWVAMLLAAPFSKLELPFFASLLPFASLLAAVFFFESLALLLAFLLPSRRLAFGVAGFVLVVSFFIEAFRDINTFFERLSHYFPLHYYEGGMALESFDPRLLLVLVGIATLLCLAAWRLFERRDLRVMGEGTLRWRRQ